MRSKRKTETITREIAKAMGADPAKAVEIARKIIEIKRDRGMRVVKTVTACEAVYIAMMRAGKYTAKREYWFFVEYNSQKLEMAQELRMLAEEGLYSEDDVFKAFAAAAKERVDIDVEPDEIKKQVWVNMKTKVRHQSTNSRGVQALIDLFPDIPPSRICYAFGSHPGTHSYERKKQNDMVEDINEEEWNL